MLRQADASYGWRSFALQNVCLKSSPSQPGRYTQAVRSQGALTLLYLHVR
jgi:hypothetical protein